MRNHWCVLLYAALCIGLVLVPDLAFAQATDGLPWESPLERLKDSLTGPVAQAVVILGIVAAGGALLFGGEFSDFTRTAIRVVLAGSMLLAAPSLLKLFGV